MFNIYSEMSHVWVEVEGEDGKVELKNLTNDELRSNKFDRDNRWFMRDEIDHLIVSTVFMSCPQFDWSLKNRTLLYETMIFDALGNEVYTDRYCTREEAIEGHKKAIGEAFEIIKKEKERAKNPSTQFMVKARGKMVGVWVPTGNAKYPYLGLYDGRNNKPGRFWQPMVVKNMNEAIEAIQDSCLDYIANHEIELMEF